MSFLRSIFEVFSKSRRVSKGGFVCPRCGNPDVLLSSWLDGWLTPEQYVCEKCGYIGPVLMKPEKK